MPPPFWIHCNICAMVFCKEVKLYMLNCSHILCKNCMNQTERGTKCPLCKKNIKFKELAQLDENTKAFFKPNPTSTITEQIKKINFQANHQINLFKLSRDHKARYQKAIQMHAVLEQDVAKMKAECDKLITHRKLMQEKLKEVYMRNQKNKENAYRDNKPQSMVSSVSVQSIRSTTLNSSLRQSTPSLSTTNSTGFFEPNAPMMRKATSGSGSVTGSNITGFTSILATSQSHSNRKPFFA